MWENLIYLMGGAPKLPLVRVFFLNIYIITKTHTHTRTRGIFELKNKEGKTICYR